MSLYLEHIILDIENSIHFAKSEQTKSRSINELKKAVSQNNQPPKIRISICKKQSEIEIKKEIPFTRTTKI